MQHRLKAEGGQQKSPASSIRGKPTETRIVRESDYSPTSALFAEIVKKMLQNNPNLNLAKIDVYTKFGQILSICSQDIERKRNSDTYQGL